jgi:hypothetical protein
LEMNLIRVRTPVQVNGQVGSVSGTGVGGSWPVARPQLGHAWEGGGGAGLDRCRVSAHLAMRNSKVFTISNSFIKIKPI